MNNRTKIKCFVCGSQADCIQNISSYNVDCPRCGNYSCTDIMPTILENDRFKDKLHILSGLLRNHFESGHQIELHRGNIDELVGSAKLPQDIFGRIDAVLLYVYQKTSYDGMRIGLGPEDISIIYGRDPDEWNFTIKKAIELNYLEPTSISDYRLNLAGWKRVQELRTTAGRSNQAFVAMWFDGTLEKVWTEGFYSALFGLGYEPLRIDKQEHNEKICDKIIAEIRKSGLLIADFTGNRGGVYFEAGFAMGLGLPVIWTCKKSEIEQLHFDTRQYNHIAWTDEADLKEKLINRIEATIPNRPKPRERSL